MTAPVPPWIRPLGSTGLSVTAVALGTSALGYVEGESDTDDAEKLIRSALGSRIRVIDTANGYGDSERRIGDVIRASGGVPDDLLVVTKVAPRGSDYSMRA